MAIIWIFNNFLLSQHNIYIFYAPRDPIPLIYTYILHSSLIIFYVSELKFYFQNIYKFIHIFVEVLPIWSILITTVISCTLFCYLFIASFRVAIFSFQCGLCGPSVCILPLEWQACNVIHRTLFHLSRITKYILQGNDILEYKFSS